MNVIITGVNGLLGQRLFVHAPPKLNVYGVDLDETGVLCPEKRYFRIDLSDRETTKNLISELKPIWIINAAGYTGVDKAEKEREECWRANVTVVENLSSAAHKTGSRIVQVSTDYIFDGKDGPYTETAKPNPLGFYGRSKLASENILKMSLVNHAIVRTMVLYGNTKNSRPNFVNWLIQELSAKKPVKIVNDQFGNTTLSDELALGIWTLVQKEKFGVFNIAGRQVLDRYAFALLIAHEFGLDETLIHPIRTNELNQAAPRPLKSGLIVHKAIETLGIELSTARDGLMKFKRQLESENSS